MAIIDSILDFIYELLESVLGLLPDSPFQTMDIETDFEVFQNVMSFINYFVPVGPMLVMLTTYLIAVFGWYLVRWILRLAQFIS